MPEAPVDHVRQEAGDGRVGLQEDGRIDLIHEPFVFHAGEDETERFLERVLLTGFERLAPVDQPGDEDRQQRQDQWRAAPRAG